jgi:hypothetical protein
MNTGLYEVKNEERTELRTLALCEPCQERHESMECMLDIHEECRKPNCLCGCHVAEREETRSAL